MSTINKAYTFAPNATITSSQFNANFDNLYAEYNGNITADNLADNAITTPKITDANITAGLIAPGAITGSKIADDAVTSAKIDWSVTGADGGVWWEELGRTTLGSAVDVMSVTSIPARKYLQVIISAFATGGTINGRLIFNSDSANNYALRYENNGGATTADINQPLYASDASTAAVSFFTVLDILNIANQEKVIIGRPVNAGATGAGTAPARSERMGKWVNTSAQISRIDVSNAGTGSYAIGSELIVLGHN